MTMKVGSASEDDLLPTSALQMTDDIVVNAKEEEEAGVLVQNGDRPRQDKSYEQQPK